MDAGILTSATVHHMEMMTMMPPMEKLPDFNATPFSDISHLQPLDFSGTVSTPPMFSPNTSATFPDPSQATLLLPVGANFSCLATEKRNSSMAGMREMIYRIAAMQPIHIDPESVKPPKRRNVKISKDPQSIAARRRRERISERMRILQRLVPGGTKMDTASMLDEAIHYVKFLKAQVVELEKAVTSRPTSSLGYPVGGGSSNPSYTSFGKTSLSSHG